MNERGGHFNKSALEEAADNGGAEEAEPRSSAGGYWTAKFLMARASTALWRLD